MIKRIFEYYRRERLYTVRYNIKLDDEKAFQFEVTVKAYSRYGATQKVKRMIALRHSKTFVNKKSK